MLYAINYFKNSYQDEPHTIEKTIGTNRIVVNRPNHGVAHSIRQGFLARDIIQLYLKCDKNSIFRAGPFQKWVVHSVMNDPYFEIKMAIASSFQRSGRQSEINSSQNPELYLKYEQQDVVNMRRSVDLRYFKSHAEIKEWSNALMWTSSSSISNIIKAAHLLDLRRIPRFDENRIKLDVSKLLHIDPHSNMMNALWYQSGRYLHISGDRDMVIHKTHYSDRFYILHNDPLQLYKVLRRQKLISVRN